MLLVINNNKGFIWLSVTNKTIDRSIYMPSSGVTIGITKRYVVMALDVVDINLWNRGKEMVSSRYHYKNQEFIH
jgi:hypothetical protein